MKSFLMLLFLSVFLYAQNFAGSYTMLSADGNINLELSETEKGHYSGELSGVGGAFPLSGQIQDGVLLGAFGGQYQGLYFQASLQNGELILVMFESNAYGQPNSATAQTLQLRRSIPPKKSVAPKSVIINGNTLNDEQLKKIEKTYGVKPKPGKYWYDSKSGLYGVEGYPAYGFMYPGHIFGELKRDASKGQTGVLVNGRELPQNEWAVWSYIIGYWIQAGSYWLDDKGNAGYQGNPNPVLNLYAMAQQNAYRGQGSGGDNFWSTRFSAGNYDSGNTRGYVSVPGHGPVGYGF